ncbi:Brassinosteroid LRR receptor kinase [Actinidia chinensis var. chinensis]|uniref:Brassinosteroid LRR receptor kinase n=1 Tax=Actinidia chinensis var. chinensis TaxID=1590841 RepID=A0A2R6QZJ7_ACTCC|nr:Brassinosteroid LRR receptor kinase [Actinidia chinensis var. chinensis]
MHGIAEKIRIMNENNVRLIQHLTTNNPPPPPTMPVLDVERSCRPQRSGDDESQSHRKSRSSSRTPKVEGEEAKKGEGHLAEATRRPYAEINPLPRRSEIWMPKLTPLIPGSARSWFRKLSPGIIDSFGDLSRLFVVNFMSCRFNQVVLEVEDPSDEVVIMAMMEGLRLGPLFDSLSKNVPKTMSTLQSKADKYIAAEELAEAK